MNSKLKSAIQYCQDNLITIDLAAKQIGVSQMYLRRMISDGNEIVKGLEQVTLWGRVLFTSESVKATATKRGEIQSAKATAAAEKAALKSEKKEKVDTGPTLNELRLNARRIGVAYSNKNKADLIAAIALKEAETLAEQGEGQPEPVVAGQQVPKRAANLDDILN